MIVVVLVLDDGWAYSNSIWLRLLLLLAVLFMVFFVISDFRLPTVKNFEILLTRVDRSKVEGITVLSTYEYLEC